MNIYNDSYQDVRSGNLEDPITYSFLDKGSLYRETIISEVNPKTILRSRAIGLRDSVGAIIFEDRRDRLYYAVRTLQDYIKEKTITEAITKSWPKELVELVDLKQKELIGQYKSSSYNMVKQEKNAPFDREKWHDFLELIKLNHYPLEQAEIREAISYYNSNVSNDKIHSINDIPEQIGAVEKRLTERLVYIKRNKESK